MPYKEIDSPHNPLFKEIEDIKKGKKKKEGLVFIEGEDLVNEAMATNHLKTALAVNPLLLPKDHDGLIVSEHLYDRLAQFKSPAKLMGIAEIDLTNEPGDKCIYLDGVQDPGNVGTIMRTALSFQYSSVFLSIDSASPFNSKTIQASKGAIFKIPIGQAKLSYLKDKGYNIYLTSLKGADESKYSELKKPFALVFGNEGRGVSEENLKLGPNLRIEMSGIDSLNVAIAAGILMYRFHKS